LLFILPPLPRATEESDVTGRTSLAYFVQKKTGEQLKIDIARIVILHEVIYLNQTVDILAYLWLPTLGYL